MTIQVSPDTLVQAFLRRVTGDGVAALVIYVFADGPQQQPVMRMASNRDDATTWKFLAWATDVDNRVLVATSRALASADGLVWDTLDEDKRAEYQRVASVAIRDAAAAAQAQAQALPLTIST